MPMVSGSSPAISTARPADSASFYGVYLAPRWALTTTSALYVVTLLFLEVQAPLAQLVYPNAQLPRHLSFGLVSNGSQPHGLELELPGMVPAFLAFHDTVLLRQLCLSGTVHETWVTSFSAEWDRQRIGGSRPQPVLFRSAWEFPGTGGVSPFHAFRRCPRPVINLARDHFPVTGRRSATATEVAQGQAESSRSEIGQGSATTSDIGSAVAYVFCARFVSRPVNGRCL